MRILVVNDDGINAKGIHILAEAAKEFGEVWVVAPDKQCSAMSQCINVCGELVVRKRDIPVEGVQAYSVSGTPADCVKVALLHIMNEKPDIVFSGINFGYNAGQDILYSGTVGAAVEALSNGIPAIAFSNEPNDIFDVAKTYLPAIAKDLVGRSLPADTLWNVNFPGCSVEECRGIRKDCEPAQTQYYRDSYLKKEETEDGMIITTRGLPTLSEEKGSDLEALQHYYISIGKVTNNVLKP